MSPPQYMGCIEVLRSMRSLDFNTRTQVTRYSPTVPSLHIPALGAPPPRVPEQLMGDKWPECGRRDPAPWDPPCGDADEGHCCGSMGGKRRREVAPARIT